MILRILLIEYCHDVYFSYPIQFFIVIPFKTAFRQDSKILLIIIYLTINHLQYFQRYRGARLRIRQCMMVVLQLIAA